MKPIAPDAIRSNPWATSTQETRSEQVAHLRRGTKVVQLLYHPWHLKNPFNFEACPMLDCPVGFAQDSSLSSFQQCGGKPLRLFQVRADVPIASPQKHSLWLMAVVTRQNEMQVVGANLADLIRKART